MTGISISSVCDCGHNSETVEHFIVHCPKYDRARSQLIDIVDSLWHNVKANGFVFDKLHLCCCTAKRSHCYKERRFGCQVCTVRLFNQHQQTVIIYQRGLQQWT